MCSKRIPAGVIAASRERSPADAASVIIVAFDSEEVIGDCLQSLRQDLHRPEIIVVDNASTDRTREEVGRFPDVTLVSNDRNLGFAAGVNRGVARSSGDPIVLLNPDTRVRRGWLGPLCDALRAPRTVIAGSKILDLDGRTLQHVGGIVAANALTEHVGRGEADQGQYDRLTEVLYVTGAALAIRRDTLVALGGLDDGYFPAYFEEIELCWQARARGLRVVVVPESVVYHAEGSASGAGGTSDGTASVAFLRMYHRNRIRFVLRNFPFIQLVSQFLPAEVRWWKSAIRSPLQRRTVLRAYVSAAVGLPLILTYRVRRKLAP